MSDSISKLHEDYKAYSEFCKKINETPLSINENFYGHADELMKKYNYTFNGWKYIKNNMKNKLYLEKLNSSDAPMITFHDNDNNIIGEFTVDFENQKLTFKGNVDASAKLFVDGVCDLVTQIIKNKSNKEIDQKALLNSIKEKQTKFNEEWNVFPSHVVIPIEEKHKLEDAIKNHSFYNEVYIDDHKDFVFGMKIIWSTNIESIICLYDCENYD